MKFFSVISTILVLVLASLVAAAVEERAYVTVTTIDTIISCAPEVTQCHHTSTSVYTPPVVTSTPIYTNSSSFSTMMPNATNSTTAPIATFTGAASSVSGSVVAVALGIVGVLALAF
ncbi:hypothetical protein POJ06DRAFT_239635 [Lipomyces tetrasporus]|uniref:Uncharacterized protein n=1 Tax=Lipomyces tetrasporus TaxID=54092 RepID=A0AAD7QNY0_9ASCO|nr:uncharacterized protein POJ06DRAFT_239635 [Lipomyces tetrasporus]KAJ8098764.1 hypothetical protein POJ06DRAFT_239635 [Lipomyces tetrasporus]